MVQYGNAGRYSEAAEEKESQAESRPEIAQNQPAVRKEINRRSRSLHDIRSGRRGTGSKRKPPNAYAPGAGKVICRGNGNHTE